MDIRPLHTEDDYKAALADVSALVDMDPAPGAPEGDRLEVMATNATRQIIFRWHCRILSKQSASAWNRAA